MKLTKFETLLYYEGATAVIVAFLITELFSLYLDIFGLLAITIFFIIVDIFNFRAYRREKNNATDKKQV